MIAVPLLVFAHSKAQSVEGEPVTDSSAPDAGSASGPNTL